MVRSWVGPWLRIFAENAGDGDGEVRANHLDVTSLNEALDSQPVGFRRR